MDVTGMYNYLTEAIPEGFVGAAPRPAYPRILAKEKIARFAAEEFGRINPSPEGDNFFDVDQAFQEGMSSEDIISLLTGIKQRGEWGVMGEYATRGVTESVIPAWSGRGVSSALLKITPRRWKPLAGVGSFLAGALAGDKLDDLSGASESVNRLMFGEEEELLPSARVYAEGAHTAGSFFSFSTALRGRFAKLPGERPVTERGVVPWIRKKFERGAAPAAGTATESTIIPAGGGVDFGAKHLLNNIGKLPLRERVLGSLERSMTETGMRARYPLSYYGREGALSGTAGIMAGVSEKVDPGDPLSALGFVSLGVLLPIPLFLRTVGKATFATARETTRAVRHPIDTTRNLLSQAREGGAKALSFAERRAMTGAQKQTDQIFTNFLGILEAEGRSRHESSLPLLQGLREAGVEAGQLVPQLTNALGPRLVQAGFSTAQVRAAAESAVAGQGYTPEIWSPDVTFKNFTRRGEEAFFRAVLESDPNAQYLTPGTTPGYSNIPMMMAQAYQLAKNLGTRTELGVNTLRYITNNYTAMMESANDGRASSVIKTFADAQTKANEMFIAETANNFFAPIAQSLDAAVEGKQLTGGQASEIILKGWNKFSGAARDVEKGGWKHLNLNTSIMPVETLRTMDSLTEASLLGGHLDPGRLLQLREILEIGGYVRPRRLAVLTNEREKWRKVVARIEEGGSIGPGSLNALLADIQSSFRGKEWHRSFEINDAISLLFRPDAVSNFAKVAEDSIFVVRTPEEARLISAVQAFENFPDDFLTYLNTGLDSPVGKKIAPEIIGNAIKGDSLNPSQATYIDRLRTSISDGVLRYIDTLGVAQEKMITFPKVKEGAIVYPHLGWRPDPDSFLLGLGASTERVSDLVRRFELSTPIGTAVPGSIPEELSFGQLLSLRSMALEGLRDVASTKSEKFLFQQIQEATLRDFRSHAEETGNGDLLGITSFSRALNDIFTRSLAAETATSIKNTAEPLLLEKLLSGIPTKTEISISNLQEGGRFLQKNTDNLIAMAEARVANENASKEERAAAAALLKLIAEQLPESATGLRTINESLTNYLRHLFVENIIEEVPRSSRLPAWVRKTLSRAYPELVDESQFFIKRKPLENFIKRYRGAIQGIEPLATFFRDLSGHKARADNLLRMFTSNSGKVYERRQNEQTLALIQGTDSPVKLVENIMKSDAPLTAFLDATRALNLMKDSDVPVPSILSGTKIPAKEAHKEATEALRQAVLAWAYNKSRDSSKDLSDTGLLGEVEKIPYVDATKFRDLITDTSSLINGWPKNKSLGQTLVDLGIDNPESYDALRLALNRIAEVQEREAFLLDPRVRASLEKRGQPAKEAITDFVIRFFGAGVLAPIASRASPFPKGPGGLVIAGAGSRLAQNMFKDTPNTAFIEFFSGMFEPGRLEDFADFLGRGAGEANEVQIRQTLSDYSKKAFLMTSPYFPIAAEEYLREEMESERPFLRGPDPLPPPIETPADPRLIVPSPQPSSAPPQPTAQAAPPPPQPMAQISPAGRAGYAAMFPFDPVSSVVKYQQAQPPAQQGIGSLPV